MATAREGPKWLRGFLNAQYFSICKQHITKKAEKNYFCINCAEGPLCSGGLKDHAFHSTLQVRRASHMDAVRINDIEKFLDVSDIQEFTINGAKIMFLLNRPHSRNPKAGFHACEICGRSIADPVKFCSVACKLVRAEQNVDDTSLSLPPGSNISESRSANAIERSNFPKTPSMRCDSEEETQSIVSLPAPKTMKRIVMGERQINSVRNTKFKPSASPGLTLESTFLAPATPDAVQFLNFRARPRKGIPQRSPLC